MQTKELMGERAFDFAEMEERVKAGYALATNRYRSDDEIEVATENHRRLSRLLGELCGSFSEPITVLELGCGTGRYFHCLKNVERLVGMDISDEMLAAARSPVRQAQITIRNIELIRGNVYFARFPEATFHVIYSLGMFGHGCPVTREVCERFYDWLKPGGKLFFNTIDFGGLSYPQQVRRTLRSQLHRMSWPGLKRWLDAREQRAPCFCMKQGELEGIIRVTRFRTHHVTSQASNTPLWTGRHLECLASK